MSEIKNGGLDQYGAGPFEQQQFGTAGIEGVNLYTLYSVAMIQIFDTHNTGPLYQLSCQSLRLAHWHRRERLRAVMYTLDVYISNGRWNGIDLVIVVMLIVSFSLRYSLPLSAFHFDRILFAVSIIVCYFRVLRFWYVLQSIGPRIIAIEMMVSYAAIVSH